MVTTKKIKHTHAIEAITSNETQVEQTESESKAPQKKKKDLGPLLFVKVGSLGIEHHGLNSEIGGMLHPVALLELALSACPNPPTLTRSCKSHGQLIEVLKNIHETHYIIIIYTYICIPYLVKQPWGI